MAADLMVSVKYRRKLSFLSQQCREIEQLCAIPCAKMVEATHVQTYAIVLLVGLDPAALFLKVILAV
jgi:hypothetical protein